MSAPIRNIDGNVIAAMSVPGPTERLTPDRVEEIAQALVEAANAVSAVLAVPPVASFQRDSSPAAVALRPAVTSRNLIAQVAD